MADSEIRMRADARTNRERILAVAARLFADDPATSMNAIAKAAGIGPGTLYRHFANREALVLALYHQEITALVDLAEALLAAHRPFAAFELWCERLAEYGRVKGAIADVLHEVLSERDHEETYWPMVRAVERLLKAGEAAGDFTPGTDPEDVLLLLGFLWRTKPGMAGATQARNLIELVIRGLRTRQPEA